MLTKEQIRARTKTVTRRLGWWFLKPGDVVWACEKCMGLRKGEKVKRIYLIEIMDTRQQYINPGLFDAKRKGRAQRAK